jgi:hypothetical protein
MLVTYRLTFYVGPIRKGNGGLSVQLIGWFGLLWNHSNPLNPHGSVTKNNLPTFDQ